MFLKGILRGIGIGIEGVVREERKQGHAKGELLGSRLELPVGADGLQRGLDAAGVLVGVSS